MTKGTEKCHRCGVALESTKERCPGCGVLIVSLKRGPTQDNQILEKDRWTFTEAEPATPSPKKTDLRFDKTMAMNKVDSLSDERSATASRGSKPVSQAPITSAFELPHAESKASRRTAQKTRIGQPVIPVQQLTVPIDLKTESPREKNKPEIGEKSASHLTSPIPLVKKTGASSDTHENPNRATDRIETEAISIEEGGLVKSGISHRSAAAPRDIPTPVRLNPEASRDTREKTRLGMDGSLTDESKRNGEFFLGFAATLLIATWFLPNVWAPPLIFPVQLLGTYSGLQLIAKVITPIVGAVVLTLLVVPLSLKTRAIATMGLGLAALVIPLLLSTPAVPLSGHLVLLVVLAATGASLVIRLQTNHALLYHITLALLPAAFVAVAIVGFLTSNLPAANIAVLKDPLVLYGSMLLVAVSFEDLISRS